MQEALKAHAERGGTLLLAPSDRGAASMVPILVDDVELRAEEPMPPEYLLLGEIDFTHPLFVPFANPRYSDFTKIHFWKHRPLALKSAATTRAVARFDNGAPAILERAHGKGRVYVFASGWQPDDSQLALSSKFIPLIAALLDQACGPGQTLAGVSVGDSVAIPTPQRNGALSVRTPGGRDVRLAADSTKFTDTEEPGIYSMGSGRDEVRFAVNLPASESNTAPLELEQLEQLGVRFGTALTASERLDRVRQERDTELESRQKIWRWLVVGALGTLILETWWAGRASRQTATSLETIS